MAEASPSSGAVSGPTRLMSLDALRGFDMFWIIGADALVHALSKMSPNAATNFLGAQLTHKDWQGFAFYDLIFPLFVFIMGVSMVFSLTRETERHGRAGALKRVFRRSLLLYLIGIFYYGGFAQGFEQMRLVGVLQRIAVAYFFAALLFCFLRWKGLAAAFGLILIGYCALMATVPIRNIDLDKEPLAALAAQRGATNAMELYLSTTNYVRGVYDSGRNVANHFDFLYLPGRKHDGHYDPEGPLSNIPAVATALLGALCGLLIRDPRVGESRKVRYLIIGGASAVALGWLWGLQFPVIKKIWTSSYVLVAGGYSMLLLAFFYWLVELRKVHRWAVPFVWIGTNAITIYLLDSLLDFHRLSNRIFGGEVKQAFNGVVAGLGDLVIVAGGLAMAILLCRWLYQRRIFLRL